MQSSNGFQEIRKLSFVRIEDSDSKSKVISTLEKRLPKSCFIYNAAKMQSRFPDHTTIYTLGEIIDNSSWIVITHYTENYGMTIMISADERTNTISRSEAIDIFSECSIINWSAEYWFVALEKWVSAIIYEVSVNRKGNTVQVNPDTLFHMERDDCLPIDLSVKDQSTVVKQLDEIHGVKFIAETWKYGSKAKEETTKVVQRIISKNETGGVYLDSQLVSGVTVHGYGLISMLYTLEEHRGKGYAKLCVNFACQELLRNGMIPASSVEMYNKASLIFHKNMGFKVACLVDWILHIVPPKDE